MAFLKLVAALFLLNAFFFASQAFSSAVFLETAGPLVAAASAVLFFAGAGLAFFKTGRDCDSKSEAVKTGLFAGVASAVAGGLASAFFYFVFKELASRAAAWFAWPGKTFYSAFGLFTPSTNSGALVLLLGLCFAAAMFWAVAGLVLSSIGFSLKQGKRG